VWHYRYAQIRRRKKDGLKKCHENLFCIFAVAEKDRVSGAPHMSNIFILFLTIRGSSNSKYLGPFLGLETRYNLQCSLKNGFQF
jgi:hypothetical protein